MILERVMGLEPTTTTLATWSSTTELHPQGTPIIQRTGSLSTLFGGFRPGL